MNKKGIVEVAGIVMFGTFVLVGLAGYPLYKSGKIGQGGSWAQSPEFKKADGTITYNRDEAWFNKRP